MYDIELTVENILCEIDYPTTHVFIYADDECMYAYESDGPVIKMVKDDILRRRVKKYESAFNEGILYVRIYT